MGIPIRYEQLTGAVYDSNEEVGAAAAIELQRILAAALASRAEVSIILATGNSQLTFMRALRGLRSLAWDRIRVFHMDEYLGLPAEHPASFRRYLREHLVDAVRPRAFYGIAGDAPEPDREIDRYVGLLREHPPVACVLGIGENGHLAFNDPPADFQASRPMQVVTLAEAARRQQVGEGHFATLDDVPRRALTLTIPELLRPAHVLAVVPERRKAAAVQAALEGPRSPDCPASILRTRAHVKLFLDRDSAALLSQARR